MRTILGLLILAVAALFGYAFYRGGGDPCLARRELIADQSGPVLDRLTDRHPLSVGLARTVLNEDLLYRIVEERVAAALGDADLGRGVGEPGMLRCVYEFYGVLVRQDAIQEQAVREIEDRFGLGSP